MEQLILNSIDNCLDNFAMTNSTRNELLNIKQLLLNGTPYSEEFANYIDRVFITMDDEIDAAAGLVLLSEQPPVQIYDPSWVWESIPFLQEESTEISTDPF